MSSRACRGAPARNQLPGVGSARRVTQEQPQERLEAAHRDAAVSEDATDVLPGVVLLDKLSELLKLEDAQCAPEVLPSVRRPVGDQTRKDAWPQAVAVVVEDSDQYQVRGVDRGKLAPEPLG